MPRIAVYECPCCGRRVSDPVAAGRRAPTRQRCEGWCRRCDGACRDQARRIAVERAEEPAAAAVLEALPPVRLVKPSARLDLPDFRPPERAL
jgi:hypothetical protein